VNIKDKIFIAGHKGLVGSAIFRELDKGGYENLLVRSHNELDLTNQDLVFDFFKKMRPKYVILAAAKVGGIHANNSYPADFIYTNIMIQANIIHASYKFGVKRLLFLGSTCIYPKFAIQPIKEDALLTGVLESTNEPYAIAKIAGIKLCESYNRQYNTDFRSVMPTNLYGMNDNFHSKNSHVIPALMRRFHEAKMSNSSEVVVWGNGKAMREFLFVDDMVEAAIFVFEIDKVTYQSNVNPMLSQINIGTGQDISILELANIMKKVVGFKGNIKFDSTKPNGTLRKLIDISKIKEMGWNHMVDLVDGLESTYKWYLKEYH
jgi:GDP-L-fucose synthase